MAVFWTLASCFCLVSNIIAATANISAEQQLQTLLVRLQTANGNAALELKIGLSLTIYDSVLPAFRPPSPVTVLNAIDLFLDNIALRNFSFNVNFTILEDDGTYEATARNYVTLAKNHTVDALLGPVNTAISHHVWEALQNESVRVPYVIWSSETWAYFRLPYETMGYTDPVLHLRSFLGISTTGGRVPHWSVLGDPMSEAPAKYGYGKMWDVDGPAWTKVRNATQANNLSARMLDVNVPFSHIMDNSLATFPGRNGSTVAVVFYNRHFQVFAARVFELCYRLGYADVISFELGMSYETSIDEQNVMLSPMFSNAFVIVIADAGDTARIVLHMAEMSAQPLGVMTLPHQNHLLRALEGHIMAGIMEPMIWAPPVGGEFRPSYVFGDYGTFEGDYKSKYWSGAQSGTFAEEYQFLGVEASPRLISGDNVGEIGFARGDFHDFAPLAAIQVASALEVIVMGFHRGSGLMFDHFDFTGGIETLMGKVEFDATGKRKGASRYKSTLTRQWIVIKLRDHAEGPNLMQSGTRYLSAHLEILQESVLGDPFVQSTEVLNVSAFTKTQFPLERWNDKESGMYPCDPGCEWLGYRCLPCPAGQHRDYYFSSCRPCPAGRYNLQEGEPHCKPCPEGGKCLDGNADRRPLVDSGYFRVDKPDETLELHTRNVTKEESEGIFEYCQYNVTYRDFFIIECITQDLCTGGNNTCRGLNRGFICGSCEKGSSIFHFMPGSKDCQKCWSKQSSLILLVVILALVFGLVIVIADAAGRAANSRKAGFLTILRTILFDCFALAAVVEALDLDSNISVGIVLFPIYVLYRPHEIASVSCWHEDIESYIDFLVHYAAMVLPIGLVGIVAVKQFAWVIFDVVLPGTLRVLKGVIFTSKITMLRLLKADTIYVLSRNNIIWKQSLKRIAPHVGWTKVSSHVGVSPIEKITITDDTIFGLGADHRLYKQKLVELSLTSAWDLANLGTSAGGGIISMNVDDKGEKMYAVGLDHRVYVQQVSHLTVHSKWEHAGRGQVIDVAIQGPAIFGFTADKRVLRQELHTMTNVSSWQEIDEGIPVEEASWHATASCLAVTREFSRVFAVGSDHKLYWQAEGSADVKFSWINNESWELASESIEAIDVAVEVADPGFQTAEDGEQPRILSKETVVSIQKDHPEYFASLKRVSRGYNPESGRGKRGHAKDQEYNLAHGSGAAFNRQNLAWSNVLLVKDIIRTTIAWGLVIHAPAVRMYAYVLSCIDNIQGHQMTPVLRMDYDVACDSEVIERHHFICFVCVFTYIHVWPFLLICLLIYYRNRLDDIEARRVIAIVIDGYKDRFFAYEPFVLLRTGWLIFLSQFVRDYDKRLVVLFGFASVTLVADIGLDPFLNRDCSMIRKLHTCFCIGLWFLILSSILEEIWHLTMQKAGIPDAAFGYSIQEFRVVFTIVFTVLFGIGAAITIAFKGMIQDLDIALKSGFVVSDSVRQLVWIARKIWGLNEIMITTENGMKYVDTTRLREAERVALVRCIQDVLHATATVTQEIRPVTIAKLIEEGFDKALESRLQDIRSYYHRYGTRKTFKIKCGFQNCFSIQRPDPDIIDIQNNVRSVTVQELQYAFQYVCATYDPNFVDSVDISSVKEERILRKIVNVWKERAPLETIVKDLQDADTMVDQGDIAGPKGLHHLCSAWSHDFMLYQLASARWTCMNTYMKCGCVRTRKNVAPRTIRIFGATGPTSQKINGLYSLVPLRSSANYEDLEDEEFVTCSGRSCWQKHQDKDKWLLSFSNHRWYVCNSQRKASCDTADEEIGGLLESSDDASFPTLTSEWKVWSSSHRAWIPQPQIQVIEVFLEKWPHAPVITGSSETHITGPIQNILDYKEYPVVAEKNMFGLNLDALDVVGAASGLVAGAGGLVAGASRQAAATLQDWTGQPTKDSALTIADISKQSIMVETYMNFANFDRPGGDFPSWVKFELPKTPMIAFFEIKPEKSGMSPRDFEMTASDSLTGEKTVFTFSESAAWDDARIFPLDGRPYRYFELKFLSSFNGDQPIINYVKFYTQEEKVSKEIAEEELEAVEAVEHTLTDEEHHGGDVDRHDQLYRGAGRKGPVLSRVGESIQSFICRNCGFQVCDACWEEMTHNNLEGLEVTIRRVRFLNKNALRVVTTPVYVKVTIPHKSHIREVGFETRRLKLDLTNEWDSEQTSWEHCALVPGFMSGDSLLFELYKEKPEKNSKGGGLQRQSSRGSLLLGGMQSAFAAVVPSSLSTKLIGRDGNSKDEGGKQSKGGVREGGMRVSEMKMLEAAFYTLEDRYLSGKEIVTEFLLLDDAKKRAMELDMCDGFYNSGGPSTKAKFYTFVQDATQAKDVNGRKYTTYMKHEASAAKKLGSGILPNTIFLHDSEGWKGDLGMYDKTGHAWATVQIEVQPIRKPPSLMEQREREPEVKVCLGEDEDEGRKAHQERMHRLTEQIAVTDRDITELAREIHREEMRIVEKSQKEMVHGQAITAGDRIVVSADFVIEEHVSIHYMPKRKILGKGEARAPLQKAIKVFKGMLGEVTDIGENGNAHVQFDQSKHGFEEPVVVWRKDFHNLELQAPHALQIVGALGEFSDVINGIYLLEPTTARHKWHWRKKDDTDKWLVKMNQRWYVCNTYRKETLKVGGLLESLDEGVAFPTLVSSWRVWDRGNWTHQTVRVCKASQEKQRQKQLEEVLDPVEMKSLMLKAENDTAERQLRNFDPLSHSGEAFTTMQRAQNQEDHFGGDREDMDNDPSARIRGIIIEEKKSMLYTGKLVHSTYDFDGRKLHCHLVVTTSSGSFGEAQETSGSIIVRGEKEDVKVFYGGSVPRGIVEKKETILYAEEGAHGELKGKLYRKGVAGDIELKVSESKGVPWKKARLKWCNTAAGEDWVVTSPRNLQDVVYDFHDICVCRCPFEAIHRMRNAGYVPHPIYIGTISRIDEEGVGLIKCSEARTQYGKDILVDLKEYYSNAVGSLPANKKPCAGDEVRFAIAKGGELQDTIAAENVEIPKLARSAMASDYSTLAATEKFLAKKAFKRTEEAGRTTNEVQRLKLALRSSVQEPPKMCPYCGKPDHQDDYHGAATVRNESWSVVMEKADDYWQEHYRRQEETGQHFLRDMEPRFNARYVNSLEEVRKKIRYGEERPECLVVHNAGLNIVNGTYLRGNLSEHRDRWIKEDDGDCLIQWSPESEAWIMDYTSREHGCRVAPYRLYREMGLTGAVWIVNDAPGKSPNPTVKYQAKRDQAGKDQRVVASSIEDFPVTGDQPGAFNASSISRSVSKSQSGILEVKTPLLPPEPNTIGLSTVPINQPDADHGTPEPEATEAPQSNSWFGNVGSTFKNLML